MDTSKRGVHSPQYGIHRESGISQRTSQVETVADFYCQVGHELTMNECTDHSDFLIGNSDDNEVL